MRIRGNSFLIKARKIFQYWSFLYLSVEFLLNYLCVLTFSFSTESTLNQFFLYWVDTEMIFPSLSQCKYYKVKFPHWISVLADYFHVHVDSVHREIISALSKLKDNFLSRWPSLRGISYDASTKRPLPVLVLPFKISPNDFIPDNHEFQVKITLV
jgi:hypothetical protein